MSLVDVGIEERRNFSTTEDDRSAGGFCGVPREDAVDFVQGACVVRCIELPRRRAMSSTDANDISIVPKYHFESLLSKPNMTLLQSKRSIRPRVSESTRPSFTSPQSPATASPTHYPC